MSAFRPLIKAIAVKDLTLLVRYPVNSLSQVLTIYVYFIAIFFGGQLLVGPAITRSFDGVIVGFFLWTIASLAFGSLAWTVTLEAQWGTLEQLYMSPFGLRVVMAVKAIVSMLFNFTWGVIMLLLMLLTTGKSLHLNSGSILILGMVTLCSAVGVGFVFAGLALVYKRIESFIQLMNIGFIGLIAAPVGDFPWLKLLPLAQGSYLLRQSMEQNRTLWELPSAELLILLLTAVVYLGLGYVVFRWSQHRARRDGLLGQY
ncbi:ABC transporter permease [Haladaptatus sp. CMAA 1911]|uniref:ABC transporter permease n=1 Tax=unclassified Haladaptatus TaxID=2622732 RepID=UPI003754881B